MNCQTGPDGALYVVDMYRGILQHQNFVTTFLREQIVPRGLDEPLGLGRIYRVLPADVKTPRPRRLAGKPDVALFAMLGHVNGWVRDTAQRLLVEQGVEVEDVERVREATKGRFKPWTREELRKIR